MTTTTPTAEQIEERAQALLDHDIFCCQSVLVDNLLKLSGESFTLNDNREVASAFGWEEVENLYPDPSDWTVGQCREYLDDSGYGHPESEELDNWRDAVRDTDPQEVFEWWLVSDWLAEELHALGCPLIRNDYGNWWGRTCTGQAILQDGTLQDVARRILSR